MTQVSSITQNIKILFVVDLTFKFYMESYFGRRGTGIPLHMEKSYCKA